MSRYIHQRGCDSGTTTAELLVDGTSCSACFESNWMGNKHKRLLMKGVVVYASPGYSLLQFSNGVYMDMYTLPAPVYTAHGLGIDPIKLAPNGIATQTFDCTLCINDALSSHPEIVPFKHVKLSQIKPI